MNRRQLGYLSWIAQVAIAGKDDEWGRVFLRYEDHYVAVREYFLDVNGKPCFRNRTKVELANFPGPETVMDLISAMGLIRYSVMQLGIRDEWCYADVDEQMYGYYYCTRRISYALAKAVIVIACGERTHKLGRKYHIPEVKV